MALIQTVTPTIQPAIDLDTAKDQLRVSHDQQNDLITSILKASERVFERWTSRQLLTATWQWRIGRFCNELRIPRSPVQSLESIAYIDPDGVSQSLDLNDVILHADESPAVIELAPLASWPSIRSQRNAITITFKAGFGDTSDSIPDSIKHCLRMLTAHFFENPEAVRELEGRDLKVIPFGIRTLLSLEEMPSA